MNRTFRLGTRGSPLALVQARTVAATIEEARGWPDEAIEIVTIKTSGDRIADRPLAEVGGKSLWTKEIDSALLSGEIDLAVHSMKDVEVLRPAEIALAAILERTLVEDRLIGADSVDALKPGAVIGTSSPRRAAQVLAARPDCSVVPIRGNVQTRLDKLAAGEADATILSSAGLDRLGLGTVGSGVPFEVMLPAPGQGAIGVECRAGDDEAIALARLAGHCATFLAVAAERAFARALGGSCHSPVAALARADGAMVRLEAEILSEEGRERVRDRRDFPAGDEYGPAQLARDMLSRAPAPVRALFAPE